MDRQAQEAFKARFIALLQQRAGLTHAQCVEAWGDGVIGPDETPETAVEAYIHEASREMDQESEP